MNFKKGEWWLIKSPIDHSDKFNYRKINVFGPIGNGYYLGWIESLDHYVRFDIQGVVYEFGTTIPTGETIVGQPEGETYV